MSIMGPDVTALTLHRMGFLSSEEKILLKELFSSVSDILALSSRDLSEILGRRVPVKSWKPREILGKAEGDAEVLSKGEMDYVVLGEKDYPPQLAEIYDPPYLLFYRGKLPENERPSLAVVGTRYPTSAALDTAFDLSFQAADAGVPVISGLALGVDTAAHQGALHGRGYTLAVLGCGCDRLYPRSSAGVGYGILSSGGCIASEYPPGTEPLPYHFPQRNRILSGLSRGVVVVQAPERSGALITADFALEQGRDLFVVSPLLQGPHNQGCRNLSESGAPAIDALEDILQEWEIHRDLPLKRRFEEAGTDTGRMLALLLKKEIEGTLVRYRGKTYRRMYQHG